MIIVVGSGLAGMLCALELAPLPCLLVTRAPLGQEASTPWAQGGIAAAVGPDDSIESHVADTLAAGDGLCDAEAVARIVGDGPAVIEALEARGVRFDRDADGRLRLGLEAAHSRHRIVHAGGDATGAEISRALAASVRAAAHITLREGATLRQLSVRDWRLCGAWIDDAYVPADAVVLATGGLGGLYDATTNPAGAVGSGIALALRAGAGLRDMAFVQFHPTALDTGTAGQVPLVSEAVRGAGARLVDETGAAFTDPLAPRDVVARAVYGHRQTGHGTLLDATGIADFGGRFPGVSAICAAHGIDPRIEPIPVRPAAHYHMGGIAVDADGRSTVPGLWACGEVACTGLHGANRLASNSLLEAASTARRVARTIASVGPGGASSVRAEPAEPMAFCPTRRDEVRRILSVRCGVLRDGDGLAAAVAQLRSDAARNDDSLVALAIAVSAYARCESRGAHTRLDFPDREAVPVRRLWTAASLTEAARERMRADTTRERMRADITIERMSHQDEFHV